MNYDASIDICDWVVIPSHEQHKMIQMWVGVNYTSRANNYYNALFYTKNLDYLKTIFSDASATNSDAKNCNLIM